ANGNEIRVGPVGDVFDDAGRESDQRTIVVDGMIEVPARDQKGTSEHEIAEAAVVEIERAPRRVELPDEGVDPIGDRRSVGAALTNGGERLLAREVVG